MKRSAVLPAQIKFRTSHLLLAAAMLHLTVTISVFLIGRNALLPETFDATGIAVGFASDGVSNLEDSVTLTRMIWGARFREWSTAAYPFHVKSYSISLAIFSAFLDFNILSAEPLNLLCYLGILIFVYKLGAEIFGPRTGLAAALIVGIWPSFLLHTTQLLKDPIFILEMLALMFVMMRFLRCDYSLRRCLVNGLAGAVVTTLLWLLRSDLLGILLATVALGAAMLVVRQIQVRKVLVPNCLGMALLIALTAAGMYLLPAHRYSENPRVQAAAIKARDASPKAVIPWWQIPARIGMVRQRFASEHSDARSNIDSEVDLRSYGEIVRYLPRAFAIGLFAPFPNMWFAAGSSVSSTGRVLSGLETLVMYAVEALALVGFWNGRRQAGVWLLISVALAGTTTLALAVINVGTLYRLRYFFLMLLMITAAKGAGRIFSRERKSSLNEKDCS